MVAKCKDVRRLDPQKSAKALSIENVVCKGRIQNFFKGVEEHRIFAFFRQSYFESN